MSNKENSLELCINCQNKLNNSIYIGKNITLEANCLIVPQNLRLERVHIHEDDDNLDPDN